MWWGGFSEPKLKPKKPKLLKVLIPMWWGGFSEKLKNLFQMWLKKVLIPMWWGGFSEEKIPEVIPFIRGLNPHVVGRFFRVVHNFQIVIRQTTS